MRRVGLILSCATLGVPVAAAHAVAAEPAASAGSVERASTGAAERPTSAPSRLLVTAGEWRLTLSRQLIAPGAAVIQLLNGGEDAHDLKLRRLPPRDPNIAPRPPQRTVSVPETASGDITEIETKLPRGRFRLWCSLPGHRQAGMRATLIIRG